MRLICEDAGKVDDVIRQKLRRERFHQFLRQLVLVLTLLFIIFQSMIGISAVEGISMEPELSDGDIVFYNRRTRNYQHGDIVIFRLANGQTAVKRVDAVAGDAAYMDETEIRIETGYLFLVGDNLEVSKDSRDSEIGPVSLDQITGKVIVSLKAYPKERKYKWNKKYPK